MTFSRSFRTFVSCLLAVAVVAALGAWIYVLYAEQQRNQLRVSLPTSFLEQVLVAPTKLSPGLVDETGDLVASPPKDPKDFVDPPRLVFAVLGQDADEEQRRYKDLTDHLAKATGREVDVVVSESLADQVTALRGGKLHLASLSTGSVSSAVNDGGFVPFCVMADDAGKFGIHMELIVPKGSPIKSPADLKRKKISLASAQSHSGFKAPLVILWKEFQLEPGLDYDASIEGDQETVLAGVAAGRFQAGAVSSDLRKRLIAAGKIDGAKVDVIYSSVEFPPQCFGYAHQLKPDLAKKVRDAFFDFRWQGTALEKSYAAAGQTKFVPISYKTDWASVRAMEEFAGQRFGRKAAEK